MMTGDYEKEDGTGFLLSGDQKVLFFVLRCYSGPEFV
jgi:hypothetical protein